MDQLVDIWNPNGWLPSQHEYRIYGDDNAQTWGVVDEIDYHFLIQWKWSWSIPSKKKKNQKVYLRRTEEIQIDPKNFTAGGKYVNPETGNTVRYRKPRIQKTLRLHTVIMLRTGIIPPSPKHELVDHIDGDETNYRRYNLRWATHQMNRLNINGSALNDNL